MGMIRRRRSFPRILLAAMVALIGFVLTTASAEAACDPGPGQASFYVDAQYRGACVVRGIGDYPNSGAIGLPNDSISSVRIGPNAQTVICRDNDFARDCILVTADTPLLTGNRVGNDQVSSLKVQPAGLQACAPGQGQAAFYENNDFQGRCVLRGVGDYANSGAIGLANDSISSVRLGPNTQAVVCKDNNFTGDCLLVSGHIPALGATRIGNDQVSSLKVQMAGTQACLPNDQQVAFFEHNDFQGRCVIRGLGDYPNPAALGLANDTMSSVRVGKAVEAIVCEDALYGFDCVKLQADVPGLGAVRTKNDKVSSARVVPRGHRDCVPGAQQVALFEHVDFIAPCKVLGVGDVTDITTTGLRDKAVSSVLVGPGVHACLHSTAGLTTLAADVTRDTPNLGERLNDVTRSVRVRPAGAPCVDQAASSGPGSSTGSGGSTGGGSTTAAPVLTQTIEADPQNALSTGRLHLHGTGFLAGDQVTFRVQSTVGGVDQGTEVYSETASVLGVVDKFVGGANGVCAATRRTTFMAVAFGTTNTTRSNVSTITCGSDQPG